MNVALASALVLAWSARDRAEAHAHAAAPRVIFVPGAAGTAGPSGLPAELQLEVLDTPPEGVSGPLKSGTVVAQYQARARDAVVLTSAVSQGFAELPVGTVLAKVQSLPNSDPPRTLWCELRAGMRLFGSGLVCLEDKFGKGAFTSAIHAYPAALNASFSINRIELGLGETIAPASFRVAKPDERPVTKIGYRLCPADSDGQAIPYRFTDAILQPNLGWLGAPATCPFGEWPDPADKSLVTVDQVQIRVSGVGKDARFQLVRGLTPGPIAGLGVNTPIRPAGAPSLAAARRAESRAARPLIATGLVKGLTSGVRRRGEVVAQVPVVHGVTGVLKNDVVQQGLFGGRRIPAGQYVYGVPMHMNMTGQDQITWCAPQARDGHPDRFLTVCFMPFGNTYQWVDSFEPLMTTGLTTNGSNFFAVGVNVDARPAALGAPMQLTYLFDHWQFFGRGAERALVAGIRVEMHVRDEVSYVGYIYLRPGPDGVYRFPIENGLVILAGQDKAGAPLTHEQMETGFGEVDRDSVRLNVAMIPTKSEGVLPIAGVIEPAVPQPNSATKPAAEAPAGR